MKKKEIPANPRPLPEGSLYFVGIGGAGMSAIAYVLAQRGRSIAGSDPGISSATRTRLESVGVTVYTQHDPAQIGEVAALVVTDAVNEQNPEVKAAREQGIPVFRRPEALGAIFNAGRGIAIAGTHGKTTTTGMVASILLHAGLEPTILIGGDLPLIGGNARNGNPTAPGGDIVLAEACEAYDGFLYLHPDIAVITNIEADHLDFHGTEEAVFASFDRFIKQVQNDVIRRIEPGSEYWIIDENYHKPDTRAGVYHVAFPGTDFLWHMNVWAQSVQMKDGRVVFDLCHDMTMLSPGTNPKIGTVHLQVPGIHNVSNALTAATVALCLDEISNLSDGISNQSIVRGLEEFAGTGRRFEKLGDMNGLLVVDDYAHHPTEIRATLAAARSAYPDRRIIAVFQPHLPSRTRDFIDDFADALASGDVAVLTDIYLAREQPIPGVSSATLAEKVRERNPALTVDYVQDKKDLPGRLAEIVRPGDLVLTMGAGDIRKAGEGLLGILRGEGGGKP